jgi:hypothetical protein
MERSDQDVNTNVLPVSINDIRDKYFSNDPLLTVEEKQALINYDRYRLEYLNASEDEVAFDKRYFELQVMANLYPYTDFIDFDSIGK